jgi:hypothetical protein
MTPTPSNTPSITPTRTPQSSACPGLTPTASPSQTPSPTPSASSPLITPTNTSTPSSTPTNTPSNVGCICNEFQIDSLREDTTIVSYLPCDETNTPIFVELPGFATILICACDGSISVETGVEVSDLGPCEITPTPSPTPTNTPTTSSTGFTYYYLARNCDDVFDNVCFGSNSVLSGGQVVRGVLNPECYEITDFCSAPHDDTIIQVFEDCPSCPR